MLKKFTALLLISILLLLSACTTPPDTPETTAPQAQVAGALSALDYPEPIPAYTPQRTVYPVTGTSEPLRSDYPKGAPFLVDDAGKSVPLPEGTVRYVLTETCILLMNQADCMAIMTPAGRVITGFDYYYDSVAENTLCEREGYYMTAAKQGENGWAAGVLDVRDGREVLPFVYEEVDLFDRFILTRGAGGSRLFAYDGRLLYEQAQAMHLYEGGEQISYPTGDTVYFYNSRKKQLFAAAGAPGFDVLAYENYTAIWDEAHVTVRTVTGETVFELDGVLRCEADFRGGFICNLQDAIVSFDGKETRRIPMGWTPEKAKSTQIHADARKRFYFLTPGSETQEDEIANILDENGKAAEKMPWRQLWEQDESAPPQGIAYRADESGYMQNEQLVIPFGAQELREYSRFVTALRQRAQGDYRVTIYDKAGKLQQEEALCVGGETADGSLIGYLNETDCVLLRPDGARVKIDGAPRVSAIYEYETLQMPPSMPPAIPAQNAGEALPYTPNEIIPLEYPEPIAAYTPKQRVYCVAGNTVQDVDDKRLIGGLFFVDDAGKEVSVPKRAGIACALKNHFQLIDDAGCMAVMSLAGKLLTGFDFVVDIGSNLAEEPPENQLRGAFLVVYQEPKKGEYKAGVLDLRSGKLLLPCQYEEVDLFDRFLCVNDENGAQLLDYTGKPLYQSEKALHITTQDDWMWADEPNAEPTEAELRYGGHMYDAQRKMIYPTHPGAQPFIKRAIGAWVLVLQGKTATLYDETDKLIFTRDDVLNYWIDAEKPGVLCRVKDGLVAYDGEKASFLPLRGAAAQDVRKEALRYRWDASGQYICREDDTQRRTLVFAPDGTVLQNRTAAEFAMLEQRSRGGGVVYDNLHGAYFVGGKAVIPFARHSLSQRGAFLVGVTNGRGEALVTIYNQAGKVLRETVYGIASAMADGILIFYQSQTDCYILRPNGAVQKIAGAPKVKWTPYSYYAYPAYPSADPLWETI